MMIRLPVLQQSNPMESQLTATPDIIAQLQMEDKAVIRDVLKKNEHKRMSNTIHSNIEGYVSICFYLTTTSKTNALFLNFFVAILKPIRLLEDRSDGGRSDAFG